MGEEKKEELKENKEEKIEPIVLKVDMHCLGCASKVKRSIKSYNGVKDFWFDMKLNMVSVKGNVDPLKLRERIEKKSGRKTELLSPLPKKENVEEKEKVEDKGKDKKPEPVAVTVVLQVLMHCDGCAQKLRRIILKMKGVQEAYADFTNNRVIVKGLIEPKKLVDYVYRKAGKHAQVVPPPPPPQKTEEEGEQKKEAEEVKKDEGKKEEEKKDDGDKKEGEEKKEEANTDDKKGTETTEAGEAKKEGEKAEGEEKKDEAGKEEEKKNGGEETAIVTTGEEKKNEFSAPKYVIEHVYPPQIFSDENPNACSIM